MPITPTGKVHELKTHPRGFNAIVDQQKVCEFRRDDRGFEVGDELWLREWEPLRQDYTGRDTRMLVIDIERDPAFGVPEGFVCMSIRPANVLQFTIKAGHPYILTVFHGQRTATYIREEGLNPPVLREQWHAFLAREGLRIQLEALAEMLQAREDAKAKEAPRILVP